MLFCCSEELKRRNESLKQAIGLFLDQPGDVGAVTGKPTGTWDEGSTASLLEQLRRQRAAAGLGSRDEDTGSPGSPAADQQPQQTGQELQQQPPVFPFSPTTSAAAADGSSDLQLLDKPLPTELLFQQQQQVELEQLAEGETLPLGPVFDTSMPGETWVEAAAAAEAAAEIAAAEAAAAEAEAEAAAAAAAADAAVAAAKADAANRPMSVAEALAAVVPDDMAPGTASTDGVPAAQAAAAPVATPPGALTSSGRTSLGSIHERVEQLEQEHEQQKQQQQKQASKQKQAMKPRATGRGLW